ncbi:MAG: diacylglycerol/lipid kinase family protein [Planctomycetaceae bacterium]
MNDMRSTNRMLWVAIQRNPTSGSGRRTQLIIELITELRRLGIRPRLFSNRDRLKKYLADPDRLQNLLCLVAAGGDGTVGDLVNRYPDLPIAILPLGTENLLARYLKIEKSGIQVAHMIAANRRHRFDTGTIGERRFLIMASLGFDAAVIHLMQRQRQGHITRWSYFNVIWSAIRLYRHPKMNVFLDGSATPLTGRLAVITNIPMYALKLPIAPDALGDDGLLDLHLFQQGSLLQILRYLYHIVLGSHETLPDVFHATAKSMRIECEQPIPIQADGDACGITPVTISINPQSCLLVVPE